MSGRLPARAGRMDTEDLHPAAPLVRPDSIPPCEPWVDGTSEIDALMHSMLEREPYKSDQEEGQVEWQLDPDSEQRRDTAGGLHDNLDVEAPDRDSAIRARNMQPQGKLNSL